MIILFFSRKDIPVHYDIKSCRLIHCLELAEACQSKFYSFGLGSTLLKKKRILRNLRNFKYGDQRRDGTSF
jgi:hypothetical protein